MATAAQTLAPPADTSTQAPPPNVAAAGGASSTPAAPAQVPSGWWDSVKDPGVKEFLANKKFAEPDVAFTAYHSLEKLMGADKAGRTVMLPKDDADTEGWKALAGKLGVPSNAEDYKLPVPEGQDDGFAKLAAGWMLKANIPPVMARNLTEIWNAHAAEVEGQARAKSETEVAALRAEWGPKADENTELARRGFREFAGKFGISTDPKAAEDALGSANFLKFFLGLGSLNAETKFAGSDDKGGFTAVSKEAAQAEYDKIIKDRTAGTIDNFQWRTVAEPRIKQLMTILAR